MSRSLNMVQIIGHLGNDPDVRYMPSGDAITNMSVACSESWKDKDTGDKKEQTEWIRVVAFRKLGEICGEYLKKGSQVYFRGKLRTRKWEKDGTTMYTTEVIADDMVMLGGKGESSGGSKKAEAQADAYPEAKGSTGKPDKYDDFEDTDIPF